MGYAFALGGENPAAGIALLCVLSIGSALVGVYVCRDAKARGMDAVLWTLAAILVPDFVGLIFYRFPLDGDEIAYCAFVYMNQLAPGTGYTGEASISKKALDVSYASTGMAEGKLPGYELSEFSATGQKINEIKITIDGVAANYVLEELE